MKALQLAGVCMLALFTAPVLAQAPASLMAGAAKVDITPPVAALHPGDTIRDPLYARAIVMRSGATCGVLVGLDQGGARDAMINDALGRASKAIKCPAQNFVISATHTHSGSTGGLGGAGEPNPKVLADAIVKAVSDANAKLAPARIAYGTTDIHLNVNRDLFDHKWLQGPNPAAGSDKTMTVIALIGQDNSPIGFYLNYAIHPINFYLTGIISADFPGEASRYIERRYDGKAVAIFAQGASGNQNPMLLGPRMKLVGVRARNGHPGMDNNNQPTPYERTAGSINAVADATAQMDIPIKPEEEAAYKRAIADASELVTAEGALIGESALDLFRNNMRRADASVTIWGGETSVSCPGRDRLDNSVREGALPPYKDGAPVNIKVGLLRVGDINFVRVNGEVYNDIWTHLRDVAPAKKTMMVTLANGAANSGYIYSDAASPHLTFQVIGSRLKPGCAEDAIVGAALGLMGQR